MQVEIWSDIACPWCYIGKRRFEAALAGFEHREAVEVRWRSFELDPEAPHEREGDRASHLAAKYGVTHGEAEEMQRHMAEVAAGEGLEFRFDIARSGNTFGAHRLLHLAAEHDLQEALAERLMRGYLSEGELISDHGPLEKLAAQAGLPREEVRDVLGGERYAAEVRDDERAAEALGITAVPFFVVDRSFGAPGAHPPEALLHLLETAHEARPALSVVETGET